MTPAENLLIKKCESTAKVLRICIQNDLPPHVHEALSREIVQLDATVNVAKRSEEIEESMKVGWELNQFKS